MGGSCITKAEEEDRRALGGMTFKTNEIDKEDDIEMIEATHKKNAPKAFVATRLKQTPQHFVDLIQNNLEIFGPFPHAEGKEEIPGVYLDPFELADGGIYIGHWWEGKKSGNGLLVEPDGTMVEGRFVKDVREGVCRAIYPNGDIYIGHFVNDQPAHTGKYIKTDGTAYEGDWLNGRQEGYGVEVWPNGETYKGDFKAGLKDGSGELTNENFKYKGEFKSNIIEGRGNIL